MIDDDIVGIVLNMTSHARIVHFIKNGYIGFVLKPVETHSEILGITKNLNIVDNNMLFIDVIGLLKWLLGLICLGFSSARVGTELTLLKEICSTFQPLSVSLKCPYILNICDLSTIKALKAIITLAISCPNLGRLRLPFIIQVKGFKKKWSIVLTQNEYRKRASRILSLFNISSIHH